MPLVAPAHRKPYTVEEVLKHNTAASLWVIMNRKVYDVTAFHKKHPGGAGVLLQMGGKDATAAAAAAHKSILPANLMWEFCIGYIVRVMPDEAKKKEEPVAKPASEKAKKKKGTSTAGDVVHGHKHNQAQRKSPPSFIEDVAVVKGHSINVGVDSHDRKVVVFAGNPSSLDSLLDWPSRASALCAGFSVFDLRTFSSLIRDKCLSIPPALSVKLPWKTGVMQQIFADDDGLPDLPIPQIGAVDVGDNPEEAPKSLPCSWQECGRGVYLGVINFKVNLTEAELEQKSWGDALEKWYIIFSSGRQAWPAGYDLDHAVHNHDLPSIRKVFGNRSANTVLRRGNCIARFMKWFRSTRFSICPFPIIVSDIEDYLDHLSNTGAGPSALSGFLEALRFCEHVVGIPGNSGQVSLKAKKTVELADLGRRKRDRQEH
eukprot:s153_g28.t1